MICELTGLAIVAAVLGAIYFVAKKSKVERIDYRGKHVAITGGSSGIGYDLAIQAFKQGAHVSVIARNKDKLNKIKADLETLKKNSENSSGQIIQIESCDISKNYEDTKAVFDRLAETAGPIDIMINNAGISKCLEFSESDPADFENLMKTNYLGSVYCTRAVVGSMKKRSFGRIVFVSSQAGQIGIFGYTAYSASKFALRGLAEALQMELRPYNVHITVSYPPDTDTPGLQEENLTKIEETRLISESSGLYKSEDVAKNIIHSVKKGSFASYFGINGFLLANLTCGAAQIRTFKEGVIQILVLPLCRLIAIILVFTFDNTISACVKKKQKKE